MAAVRTNEVFPVNPHEGEIIWKGVVKGYVINGGCIYKKLDGS
jgi:hypothetical protein